MQVIYKHTKCFINSTKPLNWHPFYEFLSWKAKNYLIKNIGGDMTRKKRTEELKEAIKLT